MKIISFAFFLFSSMHLHVQSQSSDSSARDRKSEVASDNIVFMKAQVMPTFKTGLIDFEDTLTNGLNKRIKISKKTYTAIYFVQIQKDGTVDHVQKFDGQKALPFEKELESTILSTSGLWEPGKQNDKPVNVMKAMRFTISNRKVSVVY